MSNENMANYITDLPSGIAELLAINKQLEQELLQAKKENVLLKQDFRSKLSYLSANKWTDKTSISIEMERLEKEQLRDRLKHEANMIECAAKNEISELEKELQKTREQLNIAEAALNKYVICDDVGSIARRYFKDKQGE